MEVSAGPTAFTFFCMHARGFLCATTHVLRVFVSKEARIACTYMCLRTYCMHIHVSACTYMCLHLPTLVHACKNVHARLLASRHTHQQSMRAPQQSMHTHPTEQGSKGAWAAPVYRSQNSPPASIHLPIAQQKGTENVRHTIGGWAAGRRV